MTIHDWWGKGILGTDKPFSFRQSLSQHELAPALYKWISMNQPQIKKVAQINPNDFSGRETATAIAEAGKAHGLELAAEEFFERGTKDMTPLLNRIIEKRPQLIELGVSSPGDGAIIVKQLHELGYKGAKAWTCGTSPHTVINICGPEAAEGLWCALFQDPAGSSSTPQTQALAKRYREKFNEDLSTAIYVTSYAMLEIFTRAMMAAGTLDTEKVANLVEETRLWSTALGPIGLTGKHTYGINRQFIHRVMLTQARDGKIVEVGWLPVSGLGTMWRK